MIGRSLYCLNCQRGWVHWTTPEYLAPETPCIFCGADVDDVVVTGLEDTEPIAGMVVVA